MLRIADVADADAIATVHVRSWQVVYRGLLPDHCLDNLRVEQRAAYWGNVIHRGAGGVAVAEVDGEIAGFVALGASRDADARPATGEIFAIYLSPAHWRKGLGSALMSWSLRTARERGWVRMTLWVLAGNTGARRFYEARGWRDDRARRTECFGAVRVDEVRYGWCADAAGAVGDAS